MRYINRFLAIFILNICICLAASDEGFLNPSKFKPSSVRTSEGLSISPQQAHKFENIKKFISRHLSDTKVIFNPLSAEQIKDNLEKEVADWSIYMNYFAFRKTITEKVLDALFLQNLEQFFIDNNLESSSETSDSDSSSGYYSSNNESDSLSSTESYHSDEE